MQHTLTTSGALYKINRHRAYFEEQIQKRRALGYCIKILVVIGIGIACWWIRP